MDKMQITELEIKYNAKLNEHNYLLMVKRVARRIYKFHMNTYNTVSFYRVTRINNQSCRQFVILSK